MDTQDWTDTGIFRFQLAARKANDAFVADVMRTTRAADLLQAATAAAELLGREAA